MERWATGSLGLWAFFFFFFFFLLESESGSPLVKTDLVIQDLCFFNVISHKFALVWQCSFAHIVLFYRSYVAPEEARVPFLKTQLENAIKVFPSGFVYSAGNIALERFIIFPVFLLVVIFSPVEHSLFLTAHSTDLWCDPVVFIVGVLAQFLWEAQAHKVSGRYIIGNC